MRQIPRQEGAPCLVKSTAPAWAWRGGEGEPTQERIENVAMDQAPGAEHGKEG